MAAHQIDALSAPAFDEAVADREVHEARPLDAIVITPRPHLANFEMREGDPRDRAVTVSFARPATW